MKTQAALFDLDGVVVNTEPQYSNFWSEQARKYRPDVPDLDRRIKGRTLKEIFEAYFEGQIELQEKIRKEIKEFELNMQFDFIPGVTDFIESIRRNDMKTAVVTSSDNNKIAALKQAQPIIAEIFDDFITANRISRSKPDPEGYLLGASLLKVSPDDSFVLEDSLTGLAAGRAAKMRVIGLSTTFPADIIKDKADIVIPDFTGFSYEEMIAIRYLTQ